MNTRDLFQYTDETSIDADLICNVCQAPFVNPRRVPCDHVFCLECITTWINSNNLSCPLCRRAISINDLTEVPHPLRNMVDKLQVTCTVCGQTGLQRGSFDDHIQKVCDKVKIPCLLSNVTCSWTGTREHLKEHLNSCVVAVLLRPITDSYVAESKKLQTELTEKQKELYLLQLQINRCQNENQQLSNGRLVLENRIHGQQSEIQQLKEQITQLKIQNVNRQRQSLINIPVNQLRSSIDGRQKWSPIGNTIAGNNGGGRGLNRLHTPHGFCIDDRNTIYIADCYNHRIMDWRLGQTNGEVILGRYGQGNLTDQLNYPTDIITDWNNTSLIISDRGNSRILRYSHQKSVHEQIIIADIDCFGMAMSNDGWLYISSYSKHEIRRWNVGASSAQRVAGNGRPGSGLSQLNFPTNIFIDRQNTLYISDSHNHRVMKWTQGAHEGVVVAGNNGNGSSLTQLDKPHGIIVDEAGAVYIADHNNHRIVCWGKDATQGTIIIGRDGPGRQGYQLYYPTNLLFDQHLNLYVADAGNHRIQKFRYQSKY